MRLLVVYIYKRPNSWFDKRLLLWEGAEMIEEEEEKVWLHEAIFDAIEIVVVVG